MSAGAPVAGTRVTHAATVDVVVELDADEGSLLEISDLDCVLRPRARAAGVSFTMARRPVPSSAATAWQETPLQRDHADRPATTRGSIRFAARNASGVRPTGSRRWARLCSAGPAAVRVAPSTSTCAWSLRGWRRALTSRRVYELFPALPSGARTADMQLSAASSRCWPSARAAHQSPAAPHGRALEGLAPAIIESLTETFRRLSGEGLAFLVVEQNLAVATAWPSASS